jgi:hypothetical protein
MMDKLKPCNTPSSKDGTKGLTKMIHTMDSKKKIYWEKKLISLLPLNLLTYNGKIDTLKESITIAESLLLS